MPSAIPGNYLSGGSFMPAQDNSGAASPAATSAKAQVIDGTPARVAALAVLSVAILVGFRWSGVKFNVTVGS